MNAQKGSLARAAAVLAFAAAGLVASAILLVDYVRPAPVFCDADGGCAQLKSTVYASLFGLPTPAYGVVGFVAIGLLAVRRGPVARNALVVLTTVAALVSALLLSVQARSGIWCQFCCVADASALVLCVLAWWRSAARWDPPEAKLARGGLAALLVPALVVPIAVGVVRKPVVPDVIARELAGTPPGQITVIDFADFECPWCRLEHETLGPVLAAHAGKIHVVRKQVPLERLHPHALDAARAACCGEALGKGDTMADALFSAPVEELTPEGCARLAASMGLDAEAFRRCVQDPATEARIRADQATFKAAKGHGLPTLWIGDVKIEGTAPGDELERVIAQAIASLG
jgi:predicted DsbA family dithiol-disulfide isomerase/uncharacterized membrane protein